jgi:hypothetical protein
MLPPMSIGDWFRRLLSGPSEAADMHEEYGTPDEGKADVERLAETGGGGSFATTEGAEAAEAELESEEAPPDPAP